MSEPADLLVSAALSLLLYWMLLGLLWRVWQWLSTPQLLPIPIAPAPRTRAGVAARLLAEGFVFRSLWRADPLAWLGCVLLHYGLLGLLLAHLRFLFLQLPSWLLWPLRLADVSAWCVVAGLLLLAARRLFIGRLRGLSTPADHAYLGLLGGIVLSGALLKHVAPVSLYEVGLFVRGAIGFDWQPLPSGHTAAFLLHLVPVLLLLFVFPLGKLVHALGIFFSPGFAARSPHER